MIVNGLQVTIYSSYLFSLKYFIDATGLEVIKLEYSLRLKIKRND